MKDKNGEQTETPLILDLDPRFFSFTPQPFNPQEIAPSYPFNSKLIWLQKQGGCCGEKNKTFAPAEIRITNRLSHNLVTIKTTLSWLNRNTILRAINPES